MFQLPSSPDALPSQRGIKHYFAVQRYGFANIGIDPTSLECTIFNPFLTWVPVLCMSILFGFMALLGIENKDDLNILASAIAPMGQAAVSITKFALFMWNKRKLVQLVRKVWCCNLEANDKELQILAEENRYDHNFSVFYKFLMWSCGVLAFFAPFAVAAVSAWKGYSYFQSLDLPLKAVYPLDPHKSYLMYVSHYIWNMFAAYSVINGSLAFDTLFSWFMRNISAQFRIVNLRFTAAADKAKVRMAQGSSCTDAEFSESIIECVNYHRHAIDLASQFDSVYSPLVFVKFLVGCIQIATLTFQFSHGGDISAHMFNVAFLTAVSFQLILYSYGGQRIMDVSASVETNIYESFDWHDLSVKTKKMLLLIMMRAQKPCILTGIFFVADLTLILWVYQTAGSFLTMMVSMEA